MKKGTIFIISLALFTALSFSQTNISGSVKGDDGSELPVANLLVRNTTTGTMTDLEGNFYLTLSDQDLSASGGEIVVSYIGYASKSFTVSVDKSSYDVVLKKDVLGLSEVVVTGMVGERQKTMTPYAISSLNREQLQQAPPTSAESAIRGKVAGAKIVKGSGQPGSAASVQLRGATSINASGRSQNPLYIVDGVILSNDAEMADIDASDIESIEVVKGAAGSSLYGARAAQGVVQIKTSRGKDLPFEKTRINFKSEYGTNELPKKPKLVKYHYYKLAESSYTDSNGVSVSSGDYIDDSGNWVDPRDPAGTRALDEFSPGIYFQDNEFKYVETGVPGSGDPQLLPSGGFDHLDRFFNPGEFRINTVSLSHNSPTTNFYTSFKNTKEPGIIYNLKGYERNSLRVNLDHKLADRLRLSTSTYFSQSSSDEALEDVGSPFFNLTFMSPAVDLLMVDTENYEQGALNGTWDDTYDQIFIAPDPIFPEMENPLYSFLYEDRDQERNRYLTNFSLSYTPLRFMTIQSNLSFDRATTDYTNYYPKGYKSTVGGSISDGFLYKYHSISQAMNADITASFNQDFNDLSLRSKVRYLYENDQFESMQAEGAKFSASNIPSLDVTTESKEIGSYQSEISSEGYYFISGLDFKNKYIADVLLRKDGSSLFGENERWQNYYRVSTAWRISEEPFWLGMKGTMDEFKVRFSQGTAGNRPNFVAQYETYSVSGGIISKENLGNKDLKPEFSTETEFGLDFSLLNRLSVQFTQANSVIEDQILLVPLQAPFGYESQWKNAGTLESNTMELSLQGILMDTRDIQWTSNFHFDKTEQKITKFDLPSYTWAPDGSQGMYVFINREGEQLGTLYGNKFITELSELPSFVNNAEFDINDDGYVVWVGSGNAYTQGISDSLWGTSGTLYSSDSSESANYNWGIPIIYVDETGSDVANLGSTVPDFNYAFSTDFRFKNFSIYALFEGQKGGNIYNLTRQWGMRDHKTGEDNQGGKSDENKKPSIYYDKLYNVRNTTSHFVEDGSYLKLQELSVRYNLNLSNFGLGNRLTVGVVGRNLLTWTEYSGYDPEVGHAASEGGSAVVSRFDGYGYPNFRTYSFILELDI